MTPDVPIPDVETTRKEKKPFAHFQWNYGWGHWEQVIEEAAGHDGVFAAYLAPCDHDNKLERLRAENSSLRVQILVLKKSADYHKSQDCIEIQNAICRQRDELSADNARLREALLTGACMLSEMGVSSVEKCQLAYDHLSAALAEKDEKS